MKASLRIGESLCVYLVDSNDLISAGLKNPLLYCIVNRNSSFIQDKSKATLEKNIGV